LGFIKWDYAANLKVINDGSLLSLADFEALTPLRGGATSSLTQGDRVIR
jgi:hypothetical protein